MKSDILVVDSGGFIENVKLEEYGEKIITVAAVIKEIRDRPTRRRLQVLPYEINYREPSVASISEVRKIASETGDLRSLSATDIKVVALTYELQKESSGDSSTCEGDKEDEAIEDDEQIDEDEAIEDDDVGTEEEEPSDRTEEENDIKGEEIEDEEDTVEGGDDIEEDMEDDDSNWVTPENISSVDFSKHFQSAGMDDDDDADSPLPAVSCITTDFAMQNVLLKMNLSIRGVNGKLIRSLKSFVLWCYSCNKHTLDQSKVFCPKCGNSTLRKVSANVNKEGKLQLYFSKKFQVRNKGLNRQVDAKYQGGKYSFNKIYSADQPMPHQRPSKKAIQREALADNVISSDNPFALRDLSSRAARMGMNKRSRTRRK